MMHLRSLTCIVAVAMALASMTRQASAADLLKLAVSQRGTWESAGPELGQRAGIFQKHGITLELFYTRGAGETLQAVIPGSADIGIAVGIMGVIRAYAKGAPVRIIGSQTRGYPDYWYVAASSPIKTLRDTDGKTIAYTTNGSSSHNAVLTFMREYGLKVKPVAAGDFSAIFTQVLTGHIDVGTATPPFGLDAIDQGKIRIVARANDVPALRGQTVRVVIANADTLHKRKDVVDRFVRAYQETIDWMFADPTALKYYAELFGTPEDLAKRVRDEFFSKDMMLLGEIKGLDLILREAVNLKYIEKPLTKEQIVALIQAPPRKQ
jgi:NitT/TauT family transport system substrate-binding protein